MKGKSSTGKNQTTGKRGQRDAFHEDIHVLELKEASVTNWVRHPAD
jgi:hypothetical protein